MRYIHIIYEYYAYTLRAMDINICDVLVAAVIGARRICTNMTYTLTIRDS